MKKRTGKPRRPKWNGITFKQLHVERQKRGMSVKAFSSLLRVVPATYHNWRSGQSVPSPRKQREIEKILAEVPASVPTEPLRPATPETISAVSEIVQSYLRAGNLINPEDLPDVIRGVRASLAG